MTARRNRSGMQSAPVVFVKHPSQAMVARQLALHNFRGACMNRRTKALWI